MPEHKSNRTCDPQTISTGTLKPTGVGTDIITFTVNLGLFSLACIVNVPAEGETEAPVYVKWKMRPYSHRQVPEQPRQSHNRDEEVNEAHNE